MSQNEGEPTKFIRELKDKANLLVIYEDQSYCKSLEFLFLDIGLKCGQACLYLSCEPIPNTEASMVSAGIDVVSFRTNNKLQIHSTTNQKKEQIIKVIEDFVRNAEKRTSRIIIQRDRFSTEQQHDLILIEEFMQTLFRKYDISVLNSYNAEFVDNVKFMQKIINMHDYTIFAPDFGKGIVIKTK